MANNIFKRSKKNPILEPVESHDWESMKVYNPGAIYYKNQYHLFYRAIGKANISNIGYAQSQNGISFKRNNIPLIRPTTKHASSGIEDPRLSKVGNKFFLTYTAYSGSTARLYISKSLDLKNWLHHEEVFPGWNSARAGEFILPWDRAQSTQEASRHWLKAGAIFPEKLGGLYWMLFGDRLIWQATSKDGLRWAPEYEPFITPRRNFFDSVHVEMGPPPLRTKEGWLVLYHGVDESVTYRLGYLLLDLHNPTSIIKRSNKPIFEPIEKYELTGIPDIEGNQENEPQIIYCNGAVLKNDTLQIYYGAQDSVICTATANIKDILKFP